MFNLTPNITLSKTQHKTYRLLQVLLALVGLAGLYFLVASIVLPQVKLSHNVRNTDPLFDLSAPISTDAATTFSGSLAQDVDQVHVKIKTTQTRAITAPTLSVSKGYRAFYESDHSAGIYPANNTESNLPFDAGSLIRSSSAYFIVDQTTLHPVASEEALLAAGYDFDTAIDSTSQQRSNYDEGKRFDMRANHPSGTFFYDKKTNQTFRLAQNFLYNVTPPINDNTPVITIDTAGAEKTDSCVLKKAFFSNTYSCTITLKNTSQLPGKDYLFSLEPILTDITSIQATFSAAATTKNIQSRLGLIKQKLSQ